MIPDLPGPIPDYLLIKNPDSKPWNMFLELPEQIPWHFFIKS